jgi:hypothetical protein
MIYFLWVPGISPLSLFGKDVQPKQPPTQVRPSPSPPFQSPPPLAPPPRPAPEDLYCPIKGMYCLLDLIMEQGNSGLGNGLCDLLYI